MAFVKGVSGNPLGRAKKGQTITDLMKQLGETTKIKLDEVLANGKTKRVMIREAIIRRILHQAAAGDAQAQKLYFSYVDGMPKEKIAMEFEHPPSEFVLAIKEARERAKNNRSGTGNDNQ